MKIAQARSGRTVGWLRVGSHDAHVLGEGAEIQALLARVVLGGLIVSTLITLVLLPALYVLTDGRLPGLDLAM